MSSETKIARGAEPISIDEITRGERVAILGDFNEDGSISARHIIALPAGI